MRKQPDNKECPPADRTGARITATDQSNEIQLQRTTRMTAGEAYTATVLTIKRWVADDDELDEKSARDLTEYIRSSITDAFDIVIEAWVKKVWKPLGYANFLEYWKTEFHEYSIVVPAAYRARTIANLAAAGMSTRAIEAITGIAKSTVARLQMAPVPHGTPDGDEIDVEPKKITGVDGKKYQVPVLREVRTPSEDAAALLYAKAWKVQKAIEELSRLSRSRQLEADGAEGRLNRLRGELSRSVELLYEILGGQIISGEACGYTNGHLISRGRLHPAPLYEIVNEVTP